MKFVLGLVPLILLSGCQWMRPHPPTVEERSSMFIRCFREEFNPSDAQMVNLKETILVASESVKKAASDLRATTDQMEKLLESEAKNDEIKKYFAQIQELKAKLSEDHFNKMLTLRAALTSEQRAKFLVCKRKMGPSVLPHEG